MDVRLAAMASTSTATTAAPSVMCRLPQDNVIKAATVAHHVQDHKGDWGLFCNSPLESLCKPCHDYVYLGSEVLGYQRGCDINGRPYKTQPIYIDKNKRAKAGGWPKT